MSTNIAINGMGRIGRMVLRIALQNKNLNVVAINASYPPETIAHLINYDTTHGKYNLKVDRLKMDCKLVIIKLNWLLIAILKTCHGKN